jgi:uncharacterized protein YaiL (DUF2058 family)
MRNPLQEQLLKAGLVKKSKVAQVAREQSRQKNGKAPPTPTEEQLQFQRLQAERAERDRAIAAERNAQTKLAELRAQARQIIDVNKLKREGELDYRFTDGDRIKSILVTPALRTQLASGSLVIARLADDYALIPRAAAEKIYERDASMIVLDHARTETSGSEDDDEFYKQFQVPDDLVW